MSDNILSQSVYKTRILEEQQLYAYTNFINYTINEEPFISDITTDLKDGLILIRFLKNISGKEISKVVENPTKDIEKIQNISTAIQFAKEEGIKVLPSVEDIFGGETKGILSFLYQISSKYRFGNYTVKMTDFSKWIKSSLSIESSNFDLKKEFSEGFLFGKLLNHLQNGIVDTNLFTNNHIENIQKCIDTAHQLFSIPKLVKAEYIEAGSVDDYCLYLYLTFFIMRETQFDDNEVLKTIAKGIRERNTQAKNSLKNRLEAILKRMLDSAKNVKISWPKIEDPETPEEARSIVNMIGDLEGMIDEFNKIYIKEDGNNGFDLTKDQEMLEIKHWENRIYRKDEEIKGLERVVKTKKRKTVNAFIAKSIAERNKRLEEEQKAKEINSTTSEIFELRKQLEEKKKIIEEYELLVIQREEDEKRKVELEKIKIELDETKDEMKQLKEKHGLELNELKGIVEKTTTKYEDEHTLCNEKNIKIGELERSYESKLNESKDKDKQILELIESKAFLRVKCEELEKQLKEKNEVVISLETIKKQQEDVIKSYEITNSELKNELGKEKELRSEREELIKQQENDINSIKKENETKENELVNTKTDLMNCKEDFKKTNGLLEEEKRNKESLKKEKESIELELKDQINTLEETIKQKEIYCLDGDDDKKVLFNTLALAIKIVIPKPVIVDNTCLYDECMNNNIPLKNWNNWLVKKLTEQ